MESINNFILKNDTNRNLKRTLPQTQYLGNKQKFVDWILSFVPVKTQTAIDAFSGSSVVGYALKDSGIRTAARNPPLSSGE